MVYWETRDEKNLKKAYSKCLLTQVYFIKAIPTHYDFFQ